VTALCLAVCLNLGWRVVCWLKRELNDWWCHFMLASLISDWHRADLKRKMKAKGIKFSPRPLPGPLMALPCRWMVLSCVMLSMWTVAMAGPVVKQPPVTWVVALGGVRGLQPCPPLPPPEPPDPLGGPSVVPDASTPVQPSVDGEGEEEPGAVNQQKPETLDGAREPVLEGLAAETLDGAIDASFLEGLNLCRPCCEPKTDGLDWTDFERHANNLHCMLSCQFPSFGPMGLLSGSTDEGEAFVDTAASLTVTPHKGDFIEYQEVTGKVLKGLSAGATIQGRGIVHWRLEIGSRVVDLKLRALHVPSTEHRLLCPQQLVKEHKPKLKNCSIKEDGVLMEFAEGTVFCPCNQSNLPVMKLSPVAEVEESLKALHACVTLENNQNLSVAQKELLKWHCRLGHIAFPRIQKLMRTGSLGNSPKIKAASRLDLDKHPIKCGSCLFGAAKRRASRRGKRSKDSPEPEKLLSKEVLIPGQKVSMDHFIVSTPGRLFSSRGSEAEDRMFKGGVIFVDHATGFVQVVPVVNFTAGEAIRAKREFEAEMASMGVTVLNYHTDNGVFTASAFQDELAKLDQGLTLSGVGAHHQNAVAERAIGTVTNVARTMMLHAKIRWPKAVTTKLWPMAMKHAEFLVNHVPSMNNVCPMDLVLKTVVPRHNLRHAHVWGAPCYVLDPKLQDGHKIPKFDPRSRQGLNLGWSPRHAATVPLVLNLTTGSVSPQFHVVFDDWFTTVSSTGEREEGDPIDGEAWTNLLLNDRIQVGFDEEDPLAVDDEWLTELERIERHEKAATRVQRNWRSTTEQGTLPETETSGANNESSNQPMPGMLNQRENPLSAAVPRGHDVLAPLSMQELGSQTREQSLGAPQQREQIPVSSVAPTASGNQSVPSQSARQLRPRSADQRTSGYYNRQQKRGFAGKIVKLAALMAASNETVLRMAQSTIGSPVAYAAMNGFDAVTETFDCVDYHSFRAMTTPVRSKPKKGQDPDYPTYEQVLRSPDVEEWQAAMDKEIATLIDMNTWTVVPRSEATKKGMKVIKVTWAFRQKRDPLGQPTKKKARLCVRGDTMVAGEDYGESFSPVVQWSSVRLMLILSIVHGLETRQVDYVNAFAQADLDREVYIEIPKGYEDANEGVDCVLKLNKSLYGMSDAPLMFFELLKKNLQSVGFKQFEHIDPCLFVHKKAICLTYVDDCLWFGRDGKALDALINEMKGKMDLTVESKDVSNFLGIKFTRHGDCIELKQTGLINKIIEATGMEDGNSKPTPAEPKTLGKDPTGKPFEESWNYASVVGMLLYLSGNSRPDIAFAVNQAARFTHDPKESHAKAIKRIVRHLIGTKDKGLIFRPTFDWKVDCHVDSDFCGLWGSEDPNDPIVSKSRTGYVITLAGCPLLWKSSLQTETSVSTMMAEYVALSTAMRDLLPLKRLVKTIAKVVTGDDNVKITTKSDVFEDNNGALTVATPPRITPQSKFFAVKLHFFKEHVKTESNPNGEIHIQKIETTQQLADSLTKGLVEDKFVPLRDKLMGWDLDQASTPRMSNLRKKANVHSRGSVENVRLDRSVLLALMESL